MTERGHWSDGRLDDKFETVTGELRALRDIPAKMSELSADLRTLRRDVDNCATSVREHRDDFAVYVEQQERMHEAQRLERKTDRRWMVGTILTATALVIAAIGLLAGHLG